MNPFKVLNKRRRRLLYKMLRGMKFNRESVEFLKNHVKWLKLDRDRVTAVPYPTNLMLELSARCNLHCVMCAREFRYGKEMDQGFMPLDKAKMIVDQALPYLSSIGLTGLGETLLYPDFEEICRYIKSKKPNVIITISTNAHFKGYLEKLRPALRYIDNLQISVDGVGEVYERIRPGTDFEFIKENIRATAEECRAYGIELKFNFVITPWNYTDMENVVDFAKEMGARSIELNPMNIASNTELTRDFYDFFRSEEYAEACRNLHRHAGEIRQEISLLPYEDQPGFRACPFPWDHPYITWNGYFIPCCGKPFPKLLHFGNVFETGNLMAVINSDAARNFRRQWQSGKAPGFCKNCQFVDF